MLHDPVAEVTPLSNGYASYMSTREEDNLQHYEAAFTIFGPQQLEIALNLFSDFATSLQQPCDEMVYRQMSTGCGNEIKEFRRLTNAVT